MAHRMAQRDSTRKGAACRTLRLGLTRAGSGIAFASITHLRICVFNMYRHLDLLTTANKLRITNYELRITPIRTQNS